MQEPEHLLPAVERLLDAVRRPVVIEEAVPGAVIPVKLVLLAVLLEFGLVLVDLHEAELKKHGKQYEFHRYDGAGHGFFYYDRPAYRIEQALDGWQKVWGFLHKHLAK